jgi:hypothetical protein
VKLKLAQFQDQRVIVRTGTMCHLPFGQHEKTPAPTPAPCSPLSPVYRLVFPRQLWKDLLLKVRKGDAITGSTEKPTTV